MENRLIYHAAALENRQENTEQFGEGKTDDQNLKEKIGHLDRARQLYPQITGKVRDKMPSLSETEDWASRSSTSVNEIRSLVDYYQKAIIEGKDADKFFNNAENLIKNPLTSRAVREEIQHFLNNPVDSKKNRILSIAKKAIDNLPKHAKLNAEFDTLSRFPGVSGATKDIKFEAKSGSGYGINETLHGLIPANKFKDLSSEQKFGYLKKLRESYEENIGDDNPAMEGQKNSLLRSSDVPDNWKNWLRDPTNPNWEGGPWNTKKIVEWVTQNLPTLKLSVARYENLVESNQDTLKKANVIPFTPNAFRNLSRHERNEYLNKISNEVKRYDENFAEKMKSAAVADGAQTELIQEKNEKFEQDEQSVLKENLPKLIEQVNNSAVCKRFREDRKTAKAEAEKSNQAVNETSEIASMRQQVQAGKRGTWATLKNVIFGNFGGSGDKANSENQQPEKNEEEEEREEDNFAGRFLGQGSNLKEVKDVLKGENATNEETKKMMTIFMQDEADLKDTSNQAEMRRKLLDSSNRSMANKFGLFEQGKKFD